MNVREYEKMLNNVMRKSPIEHGVQTLVYMFLYEMFENINYDLVVVDTLRANTKYLSYTGISDIAIVNDDFVFEEVDDDKSKIMFCIEVKAINQNIAKHQEQLLGQLLTFGKAMITNGKEWIYYDIEDYINNNTEDEIKEIWVKNDFNDMRETIATIISKERIAAQLISSKSHIKEQKIKDEIGNEILELKKEIKKQRENIECIIEKNSWLNDFLDNATWNINLIKDKKAELEKIKVDKDKYIELIQKLYGVLLTI